MLVETRSFILKEFPQEGEYGERLKIKTFLKNLKDDGLIEIGETVGVSVVKVGGQVISRSKLSVTARLKLNGIIRVEDHRTQKLNRRYKILAIILALIPSVLAIKSFLG